MSSVLPQRSCPQNYNQPKASLVAGFLFPVRTSPVAGFFRFSVSVTQQQKVVPNVEI